MNEKTERKTGKTKTTEKPSNLLIAAQSFIRPGKIFLQIDFVLIAMKSEEISTTTLSAFGPTYNISVALAQLRLKG